MRVNVYIDGFNLYYGAVKDTNAPPGKGFARVIKTEEKGSDVNLA
jgi:hypothetical protein